MGNYFSGFFFVVVVVIAYIAFASAILLNECFHPLRFVDEYLLYIFKVEQSKFGHIIFFLIEHVFKYFCTLHSTNYLHKVLKWKTHMWINFYRVASKY